MLECKENPSQKREKLRRVSQIQKNYIQFNFSRREQWTVMCIE